MLYKFFSIIVVSLIITGCAEFDVPTPDKALQRSLGSQPESPGVTKDEIRAEWGDPDEVIDKGDNRWGAQREEWVYYGRYPDIPIDYKYVSKTKRFIFVGNVLEKSIFEEPAKKSLEEEEETEPQPQSEPQT